MVQVKINNLSHPLNRTLHADYCSTFWSRLKGLMFRQQLNIEEGLLLVESRDSRLDSAIHMLFMNFDLAIVWVNDAGYVVDTCFAKRWKPAYIPSQPARYILEFHPERLSEFRIGDQIEFSRGS